MKVFTTLVALGAVAAASSTMALADTLLVNNGGATAITTSAAPTGSIVASISGTLSATSFTASYTETVYQATNNVNGAGDLTFVITLMNSASSMDSLERITTGLSGDGFASFVTFAGYEAFTGTEAPLAVSEQNGAIGFTFNTTAGNNSILPGGSSDTLILQTNATNFALGNLSAQDTLTANAVGYIPAAATPEPNSLVLLGTGLIGAAGMLFMRRRNAESLL